jgi:hypothetical protein
LSQPFIESQRSETLAANSIPISESISLSSDPTIVDSSSLSISFDSISVSGSSAFHDSVCFSGSDPHALVITFSDTVIFSRSQSLSRTIPFSSSPVFHSGNSVLEPVVPASTIYTSFRSDLTRSYLSSVDVSRHSVSDTFAPTEKPDVRGDSGQSTPIIIGVTVGVLFLILAIILVLFVMHRKQPDPVSDLTVDTTETGHEYDNPMTIQHLEMDLSYTAATVSQLTLFE